MRTATTVELSSATGEVLTLAVEAEKLGLDVCWVAEAWGSDAPSALGYIAARTERMLLGSGVLQVGTRSPVMVRPVAVPLISATFGRASTLRRMCHSRNGRETLTALPPRSGTFGWPFRNHCAPPGPLLISWPPSRQMR